MQESAACLHFRQPTGEDSSENSCCLLQGFLGISLLIEGLLFGFHLKGSALDMRLHLILVLIVFLSSLVCFLEIQYPHSFPLSTVRAQLVMLQGVWFYQIAAILFKGNSQHWLASLTANAEASKSSQSVVSSCRKQTEWQPHFSSG